MWVCPATRIQSENKKNHQGPKGSIYALYSIKKKKKEA